MRKDETHYVPKKKSPSTQLDSESQQRVNLEEIVSRIEARDRVIQELKNKNTYIPTASDVKISDLEGKMQVLQEQCKTFRQSSAIQNQKLLDKESELIKKENEIKNLKVENEQLKLDIQQLQINDGVLLSQLQRATANLNSSSQILQHKENAFSQDRNQILQQLAKEQQTRSLLEKECSNLQNYRQKLEAAQESSCIQIEKLEKSIISLKESIISLKKTQLLFNDKEKLTSVNQGKKLEEHEQYASNLQMQIDQLEEQVERYKELESENTNKINVLLEEKQQAQDALEKQNTKIEELSDIITAKNTSFEEKNDALKKENKNLIQKNKILTDKNSQLQDENSKLKETIAQLQNLVKNSNSVEIKQQPPLKVVPKLSGQNPLEKKNVSSTNSSSKKKKKKIDRKDKSITNMTVLGQLKAMNSKMPMTTIPTLKSYNSKENDAILKKQSGLDPTEILELEKAAPFDAEKAHELAVRVYMKEASGHINEMSILKITHLGIGSSLYGYILALALFGDAHQQRGAMEKVVVGLQTAVNPLKETFMIPQAASWLGFWYAAGKHVEKNLGEALKYFTIAADQKYLPAMEGLNKLSITITGKPKISLKSIQPPAGPKKK